MNVFGQILDLIVKTQRKIFESYFDGFWGERVSIDKRHRYLYSISSKSQQQQKKELQVNISNEHRFKNPEQNINKSNPTIC